MLNYDVDYAFFFPDKMISIAKIDTILFDLERDIVFVPLGWQLSGIISKLVSLFLVSRYRYIGWEFHVRVLAE